MINRRNKSVKGSIPWMKLQLSRPQFLLLELLYHRGGSAPRGLSNINSQVAEELEAKCLIDVYDRVTYNLTVAGRARYEYLTEVINRPVRATAHFELLPEHYALLVDRFGHEDISAITAALVRDWCDNVAQTPENIEETKS